MEKSVNLKFLIDYLLLENGGTTIGAEYTFEKYRSLVNTRLAVPIDKDYIDVEMDYLSILLAERGVVTLDELNPIYSNIYLWKGDITRLEVDAIVNACNPNLRGCYIPNHACIDNTIHTFAGVSLRLECEKIMRRQAAPEVPGKAKITRAYSLPSKHVIHTVGPMILDSVEPEDFMDLKNCYISCLKLAIEKGLKSIAFCCISAGIYRFPSEMASEIAINTVTEYLNNNENNGIKVIFNVYKEFDYHCYHKGLTS